MIIMVSSMLYMAMHAMYTSISVYDSLYLPKVLHVARYGDRSFLFEPVLFLGLLQEREEKWVIQVNHRNDEPLWFFPSRTDQYPHATLRRYGAVFVDLATVLQVQAHPHGIYTFPQNEKWI